MTGKTEGGYNPPFSVLYEAQQEYQGLLYSDPLPTDNLQVYSYHVQAMVEELGELMKSDKRWKTHRNAHYDPRNKLEEIADVFITAINLAMYSGFDSHDVAAAIICKIGENKEKLLEKIRGEIHDSYR